jgi:hypothetical protein
MAAALTLVHPTPGVLRCAVPRSYDESRASITEMDAAILDIRRISIEDGKDIGIHPGIAIRGAWSPPAAINQSTEEVAAGHHAGRGQRGCPGAL